MRGRLFRGYTVEIDPSAVRLSGSWRPGLPSAYNATQLEFFHWKLTEIEEPVYLDIGANTGAFTMLTGVSDARCIAFEPNPDMVAAIKACLKLNPDFADNVTVMQCALSNRVGQHEKLYIPDVELGMARLDHDFPLADSTVIEATVGLLDNLPFIRVDLMKIDVEGHEKMVLEGAEKTIKEHKPGIFMEWYPPNCEVYGYHPDELDEMLAGWGYAKTETVGHFAYYEEEK